MNGFELILPFLRPIQHLILDSDISEIMVNGSERVFIERQGYIEQVQDISLSPKSLEVAVKNIAAAWATTSRTRNLSSTHGCRTEAAWQLSSRRAA